MVKKQIHNYSVTNQKTEVRIQEPE